MFKIKLHLFESTEISYNYAGLDLLIEYFIKLRRFNFFFRLSTFVATGELLYTLIFCVFYADFLSIVYLCRGLWFHGGIIVCGRFHSAPVRHTVWLDGAVVVVRPRGVPYTHWTYATETVRPWGTTSPFHVTANLWSIVIHNIIYWTKTKGILNLVYYYAFFI